MGAAPSLEPKLWIKVLTHGAPAEVGGLNENTVPLLRPRMVVP
jgi:hypothetical protein